MPSYRVMLHELYDKQGKIPDVPDCYLVSIQSFDEQEMGSDPKVSDDGVHPIPYLASEFDPLQSARTEEIGEWLEYYDMRDDNCVRFGLGLPSVSHSKPIFLTFRWGEGHPGDILPHEGYGYCAYCRHEFHGHPSDCRGKRLLALADAVLAGDIPLAVRHATLAVARHQPSAYLLKK